MSLNYKGQRMGRAANLLHLALLQYVAERALQQTIKLEPD